MKLIEVKIETQSCCECKTPMVDMTRKSYVNLMTYTSSPLYSLFPKFCGSRLIDQLKAQKIPFISDVQNTKGRICENCAKDGKAEFLCKGCNSKHPTENLRESFGDTSDGGGSYLCKTCYSTLTAEKWEDLTEELNAEHRWDFE